MSIDDGPQVPGRNRPHVTLHHFTRGVDDCRGRQAFQGFEGYQRGSADLQVWEIDIEGFKKGACSFSRDFFEVDGDDLNLGVVCLETDQLGQFTHTGTAPGGPEVDHDPAAPEVREADRIAIQVVQCEVDRLGLNL